MSDTMTLFSTAHGYSDLAGGGEPLSPLDGRYRAVAAPLVNYLSEAGLNRARVHVSGHAGAEELKIVLSIVRPKAFMPVHGEATHLRAHAKLAEATGADCVQVIGSKFVLYLQKKKDSAYADLLK